MSANYQVRFEWGSNAITQLPADVYVIADADGGAEGVELAQLVPGTALAIRAGLDAAACVTSRVIDLQRRRGERVFVVIVGAGERWPDGSLRVSVADTLVAGRVVDALAEAGIDFHDPASALACAAATTLRGAVRHLAAA